MKTVKVKANHSIYRASKNPEKEIKIVKGSVIDVPEAVYQEFSTVMVYPNNQIGEKKVPALELADNKNKTTKSEE